MLPTDAPAQLLRACLLVRHDLGHVQFSLGAMAQRGLSDTPEAQARKMADLQQLALQLRRGLDLLQQAEEIASAALENPREEPTPDA
jgi:hypothetical protein